VDSVADTNIFARAGKDGRQFLVYQMTFSAKDDLAMILPLPVPKDPKEDAVRFINLEGYADFFKELHAGFPSRAPKEKDLNVKSADPPPKLKVVDVGSFEASFVPTVKDFGRLDERFRLPAETWDKLPAYKDYGFAVFKLKKGARKVHPMAFEFPRANANKLFFPTVHIHDGKVHDRAAFDHALFCQLSGETLTEAWEESPRPANLFMKVDKAQGLLVGDGHCYRREMRGKLKNEDIFV
jgi:hypothetical protein